MFSHRPRPKSRNHLVLFVTTTPRSSPDHVKSAIKKLNNAGAALTVLALGNNIDLTELEKAVPKESIIVVDPNGPPKRQLLMLCRMLCLINL